MLEASRVNPRPLPMMLAALAVWTMGACRGREVRPELPAVAPRALRAVQDFAFITNPETRSKAFFLESTRVFLHPRCSNCHPAGDSPMQGMEQTLHLPSVQRGADNTGNVGMRCTSCHQEENLDIARVPGAPNWHLAPKEMAWVGKTPRELCEQVKDPSRNGGKSLAELVEHSRHDALVAWGWNPGHGREPAPGSQAQFGDLLQAWVDSGALCPEEDWRP